MKKRPTHTFQRKIIGPVFVIVTLTILVLTALVTLFEKNRFQRQELRRIYYETQVVNRRLGQQMFSADWQAIVMTLENASAADPSILYYVITDMNGAILACDEKERVGQTGYDTVRMGNGGRPVFEHSILEIANNIPAWARIYTSRLSKAVVKDDLYRARQGEKVFDAHWDITYMSQKLGTLRIGFSRRELGRHLVYLVSGMLCTGFFVLMVTLASIYVVVKKNLKPLDLFVDKISDLQRSQGAGVLRHRLAVIRWEDQDTSIEEIQRLKRAFSNIRDLFILNWDQLENQRQNLEEMVGERTRELQMLNEKLTRQFEDQKAIENRLINSQKLEAIGTLAGGIAHEFNNLFMAVTGYASLIQKHAPPDHSNFQRAEKIRDLVDQGSHSVKQLMAFARAGKYRSGPMNINEVLRTGLDIFKRSRKDITLETRLAENIWTIHADRSQIEQVFMNLLLNASEAMPGNGVIIVETRNVQLKKKMVGAKKIVSGRFVHVQVRDQGKGIKKEHIQRVFDPFFTTKPLHEGSGLGLASVYGVVDNHGGFTTVESTEGKGAVFNLFFPALEEKAKTKQAED